MSLPARIDALVIGGGFYGARLALTLRSTGRTVLLVERDAELMMRASLVNQARVHNGYHYPRSILTSLRSRMNYARFLGEYAECVDRSFPHYYAIGRVMSKITAAQFVEFCRRIEAPLIEAPAPVRKLFDSSRIEAVFEVQECAFDAARLRSRLARELEEAGVMVALSTEAVHLECAANGTRVALRDAAGEHGIVADLVLSCTYSRLNHLLSASGGSPIPAKHELTELALVEPPPELGGAAVTVMDGPFFSLMPYPSRNRLFTLSHVRYTPHCNWYDATGGAIADGDAVRAGATSRFAHMVHDAARYLPAMRNSRYVESLFEIKTVLPRSEQDDSRPILLRRSEEFPGVFTVLGAKIDSVYDVEEALGGVVRSDTEGVATKDRSSATLLPRSSAPAPC